MRPHKYFSLGKNKDRKNSKFIQSLISYIVIFSHVFSDDNQDGCENYFFFVSIQNKIEL